MRILVAEDSRTQAESLRYILEKNGHLVTLAPDGKKALEEIRSSPPDLVLTDIMMPEMDGYELCRRIRAEDRLRNLPVIIVTQLFDPIDVVRGLEAGADNFIIKPYESRDIEARIAEVVNMPPSGEVAGAPLVVRFSDGSHTVTAGRRQILNILLSTYELTVRKNAELLETQERVSMLNDQLRQAVAELRQANLDLQEENGERRKVEKALAEANRKLQLMASITRHDLRNQLTGIRQYLELAAALRTKDPDKAWTRVGNAASVVNQTIHTVEFTGEYQEIGIMSPVWKNARILVDESGRYANLGRIRLENAIPASVEIYADPLIEKVFFNLIDNAVRYGKKITTITFRFVGDEGREAIICEDDGVGIAEAEKGKIFAYEYGSNTGLGLFLSREILTITGITICENGIPGKGARFEMRCPKGTIRVKP